MGLVHVHDAMRGYLMTGRWALDLKPGDVLWTQAQPGWFMNVVYNAFAPWLCGVPSFITGKLTSADEFYRHVQENGVSVVYATPTVYRMLVEAETDTARAFRPEKPAASGERAGAAVPRSYLRAHAHS